MQKKTTSTSKYSLSFFQPFNRAVQGNQGMNALHNSPNLPVLDIPNNRAVRGDEDLNTLHNSLTTSILLVLDIPNNRAINGNEDLSELFNEQDSQFNFG